MRIPELIKSKRKQLKETQKDFGKRFNVSHVAVGYWESGVVEAPYKVLYFIFGQTEKPKVVCPTCNGKGKIITNSF